MALRLELAQKQTQKLILSPQMQQAINILQLPLMDLRALAAQEMASNPVLEDARQDEADIPKEDLREKSDATEVEFKEEFNRLLELDNEWRDYFKQVNTIKKATPEDDEKRRYFEDSITAEESLQDYLLKQLQHSSIDDRQIAEHIIGNIDNRGYLICGIEEIAYATSKPPEKVATVLKEIQTFDPSGIGAQSLEECLILQLEQNGRITPMLRKLIENHLEDLSKKKFPYIAKKLKTTVEEIVNAVAVLTQLEPKPGRFFSSEKTHYIIPDVIVEKIDGQYQIILNNDRIPHLRISNTYRQLMKDSTAESTKNYIKEKVKAGMWFIKNINQRQRTILNIATQLVEEQKAFFEEGVSALKPLTMQQMADKLGIHESTVSRAIANKYIQTPQGLFAMKYFFTTAIATYSGTTVSAENAKEAVASLVREEDKKTPLSDQEIVRILSEQNIKLARRTVAKYRKELNILPSNMRKVF